MDKNELERRAEITLTQAEYDMIVTVYMEMSTFSCVGDVVEYIKSNGIQGILHMYDDAAAIKTMKESYKALWNEKANINRQKEEIEAQLIDSRREVREKEKVIEYLCSLLSTEEILAGTDMDKTKIAQFAALYKGVA